MENDLRITTRGAVTILEVTRGPANYFDHSLLKQIADAAERLEAGTECRALVLCSEGRHFCAGANFGSGELSDNRDEASSRLYHEGIRLFRVELPIVAAVQGSAVGGGMGLACAADFRVASDATRFHPNFSALGFHHGFGLSATLPRIVGHQKALDLLLTSRRLTGSEAAGIGLVDRQVEPGEERAGAIALAEEVASMAPLAVRSIKQTLRAGLADEASAALERELHEQQWLWKTRDSQIGIEANLRREHPTFIGE